jgi:hypothetical protein
MSTETLTLINNPGSYDLGAVNYTTKVVKAINDQFTNPACSGTIEFRLEYCDIATIPANIPIGTGIQYGSTVNLTTWFNRGANTSIEYTKTINGTTTVISNPTTFTFNQPENTGVTITLRDTQLTSPECKASVTKTVLNQPSTCRTYYVNAIVHSYQPELEYIIVSYIPCNGGFGTEADRVTYGISLFGAPPYANIGVPVRVRNTENMTCILEGSLTVSASPRVQITGTSPSTTCNI